MNHARRRTSRSHANRLNTLHTKPRRWASLLSVFAVTLGLVAGAGAAPAQAAGPAVLTLELAPVNASTGAAIATAGFGQNGNKVAYRVAFSCSVATCTGATVSLPATQLDPTYDQFRLLSFDTWTPPAGGGASISGDAATGLTVSLGDVPAGTSSTFLVVYSYPAEGSYTTATTSTYFPPGFQIEQAATIDSPNATGPVTASAAPVTWQIDIPSPSIAKVGPTSIRPDTDITYTIRMGSGCFVYGGSGRIIGNGSQLCAESFTVVDELPAEAEFVSASDGGVYNATENTVTWTTSGPSAAGGWGSSAASGWTNRGVYHPRTVTVRYPASAFPEGDGGADFTASVTNDARVTVTYLDDAETTKTATASHTHDVARITPFARATQTKTSTADYTSGGRRYVNVPPDVSGLTCPETGSDDWGRACTPGEPLAVFPANNTNTWSLDTYNRGNVPAVATVTDDDLGDSAARVIRINTTTTTPAATIAYTLTNGTTTSTGTATGSFSAPAGSWITAVTVTSGSIPATNVQPSDTGGTLFRVAMTYSLIPGAEPGDWVNNATGTLSYPEYPELDAIPLSSQGQVTLRERPKVAVSPRFGAEILSATVAGGGQAVPGSEVTFAVRGDTSGIPANEPISPQYVFIAPEGWDLVPGSASFAAGTVPPGAAFVYRDVTIGGAVRHAVVASWPTGTTFGSNVTWPTMQVVASPTYAVAAGTASTATLWTGDSLNQHVASGPTWGTRVIDTPDVDGDGDTTEAFASATQAVTVSGSDRLDIVKEICVETAEGCTWVSNPDIVVGVAPDAEDIAYRVTLRNGGNTTLTGVVGYDILPFIGDARSSTFSERLGAISTSTGNLTLAYSNSTNPCRDEVVPDAGNPGCAPAWDAAATGAASVRAVVDGPLQPGESASFTFSATVVPGAPADAVACNSVAADTASTVPTEPRAVCATTQQADLTITVPERLPLQAGRPGVVPFTVTNLGGSASAPASVAIQVPAGIRITSLAPAGWSCAASETAPDGSVLGPVTLDCDAVTPTGTARSLTKDAPDALDLPAVIPSDALVGERTCFPARVTGLMSDPDPSNNEAETCSVVLAGDALVSVSKDDGLTQARIGDEITYSIEVANHLVGESLDAVTVTDALPDYLSFVSASGGGAVSDQGSADADGHLPGGTVTWTLPSLSGSGVAGDGDEGTGAAGSTRTVTVTVRVLQSAETREDILNEASVAATDPANPDLELTDADGDTDALLRTAAIQLVKSVTSGTIVGAFNTVSYAFLVTNSGDVTLTDVEIAETAFTGTGSSPLIDCPLLGDGLAPDQSITCTASYLTSQADVDAGFVSNTAVATATPPSGLDPVTSLPSTAVAAVEAHASLDLFKTVGPSVVTHAGDVLTYGFRVRNDGNVTLTGVAIVETAFTGDPGGLSAISCPSGPLAPSNDVTCTATYTVTQADIEAGMVANTAYATADAPGSLPNPVSPPSTAQQYFLSNAGLSLDIAIADPSVDAVGETVTYLLTVTNTGNRILSGIGISEGTFSGSNGSVAYVCPDDDLAPGDVLTCVGTYVLTQADVDSGSLILWGHAVGSTLDGGSAMSLTASAELLIAADPSLSLVKSATPTDLVRDQEVTYSFVVTNTGNVTLRDVAVVETGFTGTGTISAITCPAAAASVAPGAQVVCAATYTITQEDMDAGTLENTARAEGTAGTDPVLSDTSSVRLPFDQEPALTLVKTADVDGYAAVDDAIGYGFRVTNSGNVTMTDVAIAEELFTGSGPLSPVTCGATRLLPGQFTDCTADYTVTQPDVDAGEVRNTARATASGPDDGGVTLLAVTQSNASTVIVPFVGPSGLDLVKTGTATDMDGDGIVTAGDGIRWSFTVTNTGLATVRDLEIVDPMAGAVQCDAVILPPGATVTCAPRNVYVITSADAAAGRVVNTATARALGAGGVALASAEATATVAVEADPGLPGLAVTGGQISAWVLGSGLLAVIAGIGALWFTRRRRTEA